MNNNEARTVARIARPGGSTATRNINCKVCGCRNQNLVSFSDGRSGYACVWNNHPTYVF